MILSPKTLLNNRYELVSQLGVGGMGEVWRATDQSLHRDVAIKTVNPRHLASNPKALAIFHDEARMGASLIGVQGIVSVLDIFEQKDGANIQHFIVMEYVDGISLEQWIVDYMPKLDPKTAHYFNLNIAWEFCYAIQNAHENGLIHRDIKPLNAMLTKRGALKIADFGLARFAEAITRTHTVARFMSIAYAAPEQWKDEEYDESGDAYQLGCSLYQLFSGRLPFEVKGQYAMMNAHLNTKPSPLVGHNSEVGADLGDVIMEYR